MSSLSAYNPIKNSQDRESILYLKEILLNTDAEFCFYGDEVGYFFCPLRRINNPSICFTNRLFGTLFTFLQLDVNRAKSLFKTYYKGFDIELINYYERQVYKEKIPETISYYTFVLSILSANNNSDFSNFTVANQDYLLESINKLSRFSIEKNQIFWMDLPKDKIIISYEKEFEGNGVLITKKEKSLPLMNKIGNLNYYYKEAS